MSDVRKRSIATVAALAVIAAVLLIYACVPEAEAEKAEQLYQGVPLDEHLLAMDKRALEAAYQEHLKLLFSVWLKDDVSVVHRINTGLVRARQAYGDAAAKIEEREKAIQRKK